MLERDVDTWLKCPPDILGGEPNIGLTSASQLLIA